MACRHREVLQVLGGQGRQFEAGVRQIDSLVAAQMLAAIAGLRDLDFESVSQPAPHAAANAAVIEPDLCTRAHLLQSLGQSARDRRRARPGTPGAGSRGVPRAGSEQMQHLAALKFEAPGHCRQLAQAGLVHALTAAKNPQASAIDEIGGAAQFDQCTLGPRRHHDHAAMRRARVGELDAIALTKLRQPIGLDLQMMGSARHRGRGTVRTQAQARGSSDRAGPVARGLDLQHRRAAVDRPGAQLGAGQVHQHAHRATGTLRRTAHVGGHADPLGRPVVRAVDSGDVHAARHELVDQRRIDRRLAGQGHHDANGALGGRRAEQGATMLLEQGPPVLAPCRFVLLHRRPVAARQPMQDADHLVQAGHHVRL